MAVCLHLRKLAFLTPSVQPVFKRNVHLSHALFSIHKKLPTLTLFTKDNCSLCDDARQVLQKYADRFVLEEVYITKPENREYFFKYCNDIPVFHFNGEFLMQHRVNEKLFTKTLVEYEEGSDDQGTVNISRLSTLSDSSLRKSGATPIPSSSHLGLKET